MVQSKSGLTQNDKIRAKFSPPWLNQTRDNTSDRGSCTYSEENICGAFMAREGYAGSKFVLTVDQRMFFTPSDERWAPRRSTFINLITFESMNGTIYRILPQSSRRILVRGESKPYIPPKIYVSMSGEEFPRASRGKLMLVKKPKTPKI